MVSTHGYVAAEPPLGAADTGGQVVYVIQLSKKLADLGYEVDIWTRRFENQDEVEAICDGVRIIRMPCGGKQFIPKERLYEHLPEWNKHVLGYIAQHGLRYQFINSHYWDAGVATEHLSRVLGVSHVHTPHSLGTWKQEQMKSDFPGDGAALERKYNFSNRIRRERMLYGSAAALVPTTLPQLDRLVDDYSVPREKCQVLPPGFDDSRFFPLSDAARRAIRQRLGFDRPVVLAVGRLARNKGYDLLLRAFQVVTRRIPEALLYVAAGGSEIRPDERQMLASLKALAAELGLESHVQFGTFIPEQELANYYQAADAFALPSRYEPFGMTALEAMACGTPTIVTTHGGFCPGISFGSEALYADPFDAEDFGIMMVKVLADPRLHSRLSRIGARRARCSFTWSIVAQKLLAVMERIRGRPLQARYAEGSLN